MTRPQQRAIPTVERALALVGLALTLGLIAYLTAQGVSTHDDLPVLSVSADSIVRQRNGWLVLVTARNDGSRAAFDVTVEGRHRSEEVSQVMLDDIPPHSSRSAGLYFTGDPTDSLSLRVVSYRDP